MIEELQCPISSCRNIPLIRLNNDSSTISVFCNEHQNIKSQYEISEYLTKMGYRPKSTIHYRKDLLSQSQSSAHHIHCCRAANEGV